MCLYILYIFISIMFICMFLCVVFFLPESILPPFLRSPFFWPGCIFLIALPETPSKSKKGQKIWVWGSSMKADLPLLELSHPYLIPLGGLYAFATLTKNSVTVRIWPQR